MGRARGAILECPGQIGLGGRGKEPQNLPRGGDVRNRDPCPHAAYRTRVTDILLEDVGFLLKRFYQRTDPES